MTYKEIISYQRPYALDKEEEGGVHGCPWYWGLEEEREGEEACKASHSVARGISHADACDLCWGRDAGPEQTIKTVIRKNAKKKAKAGALARILSRIVN